MTIDLDDIEAKAKAATPGKWYACEADRTVRVLANMRGEDGRAPYIIARFPMRTAQHQLPHSEWLANHDHIASASPSTTLALVARIRELEQARDGLSDIAAQESFDRYQADVRLRELESTDSLVIALAARLASMSDAARHAILERLGEPDE